MVMLKRFYISVWATIEGYQYSRPPAHIVGIFATDRKRAEEGFKRELNAKLFDVIDAVEAADIIETALTLEQFRMLKVEQPVDFKRVYNLKDFL